MARVRYLFICWSLYFRSQMNDDLTVTFVLLGYETRCLAVNINLKVILWFTWKKIEGSFVCSSIMCSFCHHLFDCTADVFHHVVSFAEHIWVTYSLGTFYSYHWFRLWHWTLIITKSESKSPVVQEMACRLFGDKPFPEPLMTSVYYWIYGMYVQVLLKSCVMLSANRFPVG